jgi:secondary thiamine-phosphate synthase enzyme
LKSPHDEGETSTIEPYATDHMKLTTSERSVRAPARGSFCDLTEELRRAVKDSGVTEGTVTVFCAHTTCSLILNEWEDGVLEDLRTRLDRLIPDDIYYAHDDLSRRTQNLQADERINGRAHTVQIILGGSSHSIPVLDGEPALGTWQRLFLAELDEPKPRRIVFQVHGP